MRAAPFALFLLCAAQVSAAERLTTAEVVRGLKQALVQGADLAVAELGREDGFLGNARVRIPLPESLARAEHFSRRIGMGRYSDQLIEAMNRAAEHAVAEARPLLTAAVRQMTLEDARRILAGPDDAATRYFRLHTEAQLSERFLPIVRRATAQVRLADAYRQYAGRAARYGLVREQDADLDAYVTHKALDALYATIAEEERAIRRDPLQQTAVVLRRVFGTRL
jgi:hypothetical protein